MTNLGSVAEFTAEFTFADGETIVFNPARPSKSECVLIGAEYYAHITDDKRLDAMLAELGPVLIRRSLKALANYAKRTNQAGVAKLAEELRNDIVVSRASSEEEEDETTGEAAIKSDEGKAEYRKRVAAQRKAV